MSTLRLDAIAEEVSLAHGGATVCIRSGYSDGHIEATVAPGAPCYIVTPANVDRPVSEWPKVRAGDWSLVGQWEAIR